MPATPAYPNNTQIDDAQPSYATAAPEADTGMGPGGPGGPTPGVRTRDFPVTWRPSNNVPGPIGPLNPGLVHNVVSTQGQWARGELPDMGYGYTFALRRPRFMREPRTNVGSYNFAQG